LTLPGVANYKAAVSSWKAAQNALDVARVSRWGEPSELEKSTIRISTNIQLRTARSAATAAKWLGGVRCFLGIVGGIAFVASVASAFLPSQPDPQIIESLNIIQTVTNETLARVKDVQVSLAAVSSELNRIETLIASLSCDVATDLIKGDVANIKSFWTLYYGDPDPNDPSAMQPTRSSYAGQVLNALALNPQFPYTINAALLRRVDEWADQVVNAGTGIEPHILNIYQGLGSEGGTGVIQRCGSKFADAIKNASPLPFDDRAYYQPLMQLVAVSDSVCVKKTSAYQPRTRNRHPPFFLNLQFYASWQARGLQMIREAYHWRAMRLYAQQLNTAIVSTCGGTLTANCAVWRPPATSDELCAIAVDLPDNSTSPILAAKPVRHGRNGSAANASVILCCESACHSLLTPALDSFPNRTASRWRASPTVRKGTCCVRSSWRVRHTLWAMPQAKACAWCSAPTGRSTHPGWTH
jgi:hypothetical protein